MYNGFEDLNRNELEELTGGMIGWIIVGAIVLVAGTLVGDHYLEKKTGKDAVEWAGTGISMLGNALQDIGEALMN